MNIKEEEKKCSNCGVIDDMNTLRKNKDPAYLQLGMSCCARCIYNPGQDMFPGLQGLFFMFYGEPIDNWKPKAQE